MNQERLDNALNYLFDQGVSTGAIAHNPFISMSKYDSDNLINPMRMTMVDCAKFEIIRLFEIENHINKCINNSNNKAPEIYWYFTGNDKNWHVVIDKLVSYSSTSKKDVDTFIDEFKSKLKTTWQNISILEYSYNKPGKPLNEAH